MHNKREKNFLLTPSSVSLATKEKRAEPTKAPSASTYSQMPLHFRHIHIPRRILGFSLVGASVMLGGLLFLFTLVQFFHVEEHLAYLLQAVVSIETNFLLNRFINWKDRNGNFFAQWLKFHSTSAFTFPLNQGLFALLTWLGLSYLLVTFIGAGVAAVVNYVANDRFVFHQKRTIHAASLPLQPSSAQASAFLPHVGVIVPIRNAQRTIRQCLSSLLTQQYAGQISIFLVGNIPAQDTTWNALDDLLQDARVHVIQIQRPDCWVGRDANMKRYVGCGAALAEGVKILAFTDSQIIAPDHWLSSAVTSLLQHKVDGIAGRSCRQQHDLSLSSLYQDASFFSEWPRYGTGFLLSRQNFQKARGLPVTNNLLITRQAWERVQSSFPIKTTYSWEDFRFAWELVCAGCVLYCTDNIYVYRNHRARLRLAKHIAAGAGASTFYREKPECLYVKLRLWQAYSMTIAVALFCVSLSVIFFSGNSLLFLLTGCGGALLLLLFSLFNLIKAHDIRGLLFPFLDMLHIGLWIIGAFAIEWGEEEADATFADLLMQLR